MFTAFLKGTSVVYRCPARFSQAATPVTIPHLNSATQYLAATQFAWDTSNMCSFVGTDVFGALGELAHDALCNGSHIQTESL